MANQNLYMTPSEVEAEFGIARGSLANRRSLGLGPAYVKLPGSGRIRYRRADLLAWFESGAVAA